MVEKHWIQTKTAKKQFLVGFIVTIVILSIDAIRKVIEIMIDLIFYGATLEKAIGSYSYLFGLVIAWIILIFLISSTQKSIDKS